MGVVEIGLAEVVDVVGFERYRRPATPPIEARCQSQAQDSADNSNYMLTGVSVEG